MASCAQQHHSCMMILCTIRLWMRAQAGASALAAMHGGACADADVAADGDADEAIGMRVVGIGGRVVLRRARADAGSVAAGDRGGATVPPPAATQAAGNSASRAPRQRVGDECRRRLMRILPRAMNSSAALSAALADATVLIGA